MTKTLQPQTLSGHIPAIPSKSAAHRLLICGALASPPVDIPCRGTSKDIEATRACLAAMKGDCILPCGESGSTLRFLLPVVTALGLDGAFYMEGRLPRRPMEPLWGELMAHGAKLSRPTENTIAFSGKLEPGDYTLPGNVSSQFISGLLLALPLLDAPSTLTVTGKVESEPYIAMTEDALKTFGVSVTREGNVWHIPSAAYKSPGLVEVEGDWSNGAFWLCADALGSAVTMTGLDETSLQGDRKVLEILRAMGAEVKKEEHEITVLPGALHGVEVDAAQIPDLVPVLAVTAAFAQGKTRICNAGRLRLKESDRIASVCAMIRALGGRAEELPDGLEIWGGGLTGGTVDSCGDHRIAMAAAVAATACKEQVTVLHPEVVEKSYPGFWEDFKQLQGRNVP